MEILPILKESITITLLIFLMMVIIEAILIKYKKQITNFSKKNKFLESVVASFFGIIPGCTGTFLMDSLYMTGVLSFGGIIAVMIATSGDETFLMISQTVAGKLPGDILILILVSLFIFGIIGYYLSNFLKKYSSIKLCEKCKIKNHKEKEFRLSHFLKSHVYNHILKDHLWKIFLWIFVSLILINSIPESIEFFLNNFNGFYLLLIGAIIGLVPISGPNILLILMFVDGYIPFSILIANSIVQDGHGLIPLLGFSIKDSIIIKIFNFIFGIAVGSLFMLFGL